MTSKFKIATAAALVVGLVWLVAQTLVESKDAMRRDPRTETPVPPPPEARPAETERGSVHGTVEFALVDRDRDVFGTVVDETGAPVADARVASLRQPLHTGALSRTDAQVEEGPVARTAQDGTFALRLTRGEEVSLRVRAEGFAPLLRRNCAAGGRVRLVLVRAAATLEVRATDEEGRPVPDVQLQLQKPRRAAQVEGGRLRGSTDAEGRYVFRGLIPGGGRRTLLIWHARLGGERRQRVDVPGRADVRLVGGSAVTGYVFDAATHAPIAGATVTGDHWPVLKKATTGEDGRFTYRGWRRIVERRRADTWQGHLFAWAEDYAVQHVKIGERTRIDFALRRGDRATGRVLAPDGTAVAGALVIALASGYLGREARMELDLRETRTDADGTFLLRGLRRDLPHTLIVRQSGGVRFLLDFAPAAEDPGTVELGDIVLPAGRRVEGRVLSANGQPLPGVDVELRGANHGRDRLLKEPAQTQYGMTFTRKTDDLGRFRFKAIAPGAYGLSAVAADGRRLARAIDVEDDIVDLELRFAADRMIDVRVVDVTGNGVLGATVRVRTWSQETDSHGRATLQMPVGRERAPVFIRPPNDRYVVPKTPFDYRSGQGELRVVLHRAASIEGRVIGPEGFGLEGARLDVNGGDGFDTWVRSGRDGRFVVRVPAGMRFDLTLTGEVFGAWQPLAGKLSDVVAGEKGIELRAHVMAADRSLRIRAVAPDGTGIAKLAFRIRPSVHPTYLYTDATGCLNVEGLPAQELAVMLGPIAGTEAGRRWAPPKDWIVRVLPRGQEVVFTLREPNPIRGVVVLPDGTGTRAIVAAFRGDGLVAQSFAAHDGTFTLNVPAGETDAVRLQVSPHTTAGGTEVLFARLDGVRPGTNGVRLELKRQ